MTAPTAPTPAPAAPAAILTKQDYMNLFGILKREDVVAKGLDEAAAITELGHKLIAHIQAMEAEEAAISEAEKEATEQVEREAREAEEAKEAAALKAMPS